MREGGVGASDSKDESKVANSSKDSCDTPNVVKIPLAESNVSIPPSNCDNSRRCCEADESIPLEDSNSAKPSQSPLSRSRIALATGGSGSPTSEKPEEPDWELVEKMSNLSEPLEGVPDAPDLEELSDEELESKEEDSGWADDW